MKAAALVVLAGCAAKAPSATEPIVGGSAIEDPPRREHVIQPERIVAPRPELGIKSYVPDLHDELRWPLSPMTHPMAEPRFPIASVFADPGVDWHDLCARGIQHRNTGGRNVDESDYLRAWCLASSGDLEAAVPILTRLLRSTVPGLALAARLDVATLIASDGDIDDADHLIAKAMLRDLPTLDTIAAMDIELGKERDAFDITHRTLDTSDSTTPADHCQRLARGIALGGPPSWSDDLEQLATAAKVPDPTCVRLFHAVTCHATAGEPCRDYFKDVQVPEDYALLLEAYAKWPSEGTYGDFVAVANGALRVKALPEAQTLLRESLYVALEHAPTCQPDLIRLVYVAALELKDPRLADAAHKCEVLVNPLDK